MSKKNNRPVSIYSYEVKMIVHIIAEDPIEARKKLDEQGGIVTKRDVEQMNVSPLYGEKENE